MNPYKPRLLLLEDDQTLGYLLKEYLGMNGFEIDWINHPNSFLDQVSSINYDLVILDVMLPQIDGFTLAKSLNKEVKFIFLTAKSMKIDELKGFALGAVDYLKKPVDEELLVVRINKLISMTTHKNELNSTQQNHIGSYRYNYSNYQLSFDKKTISLTHKENELLNMLVQNKNNLCLYKDILTQLWDKNDYFNRKSLNVYISKLRSYLAHDPKIKIENIHSKGFVLRAK